MEIKKKTSLWFMVTELEDEIGENQVRTIITLKTSDNHYMTRRIGQIWKKNRGTKNPM